MFAQLISFYNFLPYLDLLILFVTRLQLSELNKLYLFDNFDSYY